MALSGENAFRNCALASLDLLLPVSGETFLKPNCRIKDRYFKIYFFNKSNTPKPKNLSEEEEFYEGTFLLVLNSRSDDVVRIWDVKTAI